MKNYLLIDFGASLMHTHHSRVIQGFAELLECKGERVTVFLPMGSEIATIGKFTINKRILIPSYHPVGFCFKDPATWIPALFRVIYNRTENSKFYKIASQIVANLIVELALLVIMKNFRTFADSIVIFPTACPISVRLGKGIKKKFPQVKLVFRLTNTAENRGFFAKTIDSFLELSQLIDLFPADIRVGYEMKEYGASLNFTKSNLYYSPTPPCLESQKISNDGIEKTFGFLGMAQKHKGTNWLVEIISKTLANSKKHQISWIIQTEDPPPRELSEFSTCPQITLLPGRLSDSEMSEAFKHIDLICLPYNVESYKLNASALAYRAADNLTAVATFKGTAFANEIEKFRIGLVVDNVKDLILGMCNFDTINSQRQILEYNQVRLHSNQKLVTW